MQSEAGRSRVVIERVQPEVDCGLFAIKRTVGEKVTVKADAFTDGHDAIKTVLMFRREGAPRWEEVVMTPLGNDRWAGEFRVSELGRYQYCVEAWVDRFESWRRDLKKKSTPGRTLP